MHDKHLRDFLPLVKDRGLTLGVQLLSRGFEGFVNCKAGGANNASWLQRDW